MEKIKFAFLVLILGAISYSGMAQCETWVGKPNEDEALSAHSVYREAMKAKDYKLAYDYWKTAYDLAPAADGKRDYHYIDGITIYLDKYKNASSDEEKQAAKAMVLKLYEQVINCYENDAFNLKSCAGKPDCYQKKMGYILGRKVYNLYYSLNADRAKIFESGKKSIELGGNATEYIVFDPMAAAIVDLYKKDKISAEEAREVHQEMIAIADYNQKNNKTYADYYKQAAQRMSVTMAAIEDDLYDCQYFIDKYVPRLEAQPDNDTLLEKVYSKLVSKKCDSTLPVMQDLKRKYEAYVEEYNETVKAQLAATNPAYAAKLLYDEGDYSGAVKKYDEAIENETDPEKLAKYHFRKASILGRKLKSYSAARAEALKAAKYKENWGQPYMLIGDLYASSSCGNNWNKRLAILAAIDKYAYAKSIDPAVASDANSRIATYSGSKPLQQEAFMRGHKKGEVVKVGCWIAENVSLRFSKG